MKKPARIVAALLLILSSMIFTANTASAASPVYCNSPIMWNAAHAGTFTAGGWCSSAIDIGERIVFQTDGNLVVYDGASTNNGGCWLWQSGTSGYYGATFSLQSDGNVTIRQGGRVIWNAGSQGGTYWGVSLSNIVSWRIEAYNPSYRINRNFPYQRAGC